MAEQGFVPVENLEAVKKNAEKKISVCKEQTMMWKRIADGRLGELKACQKQLKREHAAKDKKLDESINERTANMIIEVAKRV